MQDKISVLPTDGTCPVCGEDNEGNHYGISCCRSCASFFKRCVHKKEKFDRHPPPRPGQKSKILCDIRANRNGCKQCRFEMCLLVGMQTECVQVQRGPTGSQSNRKRKTSAFGMSLSPEISTTLTPPPDVIESVTPSIKRKLSYVNDRTFNVTPIAHNMPSFVSASLQNGLKRHKNLVFEPPAPSVAIKCTPATPNMDSEELCNFPSETEKERKIQIPLPPFCPSCENGACSEGLETFVELIKIYGDSLRHMQLNHLNLDNFVAEICQGVKLRELEPSDIDKLSDVELAGLLLWVEKMGHFKSLPDEDKTILLNRYSVRKLSLDNFFSASKHPVQVKKRIFVLNNYTFVPEDAIGFTAKIMDIHQQKAKNLAFSENFERLWTNVIDRFIEMRIGNAEIVFMHYLLMWTSQNQHKISRETRPLLQARRSWTLKMMFEFYESINYKDPEIRIGELIFLFQELEIVIDMHCTDVHLSNLFDIGDTEGNMFDKFDYSCINVEQQLDGTMDGQNLLTSCANMSLVLGCYQTDLSTGTYHQQTPGTNHFQDDQHNINKIEYFESRKRKTDEKYAIDTPPPLKNYKSSFIPSTYKPASSLCKTLRNMDDSVAEQLKENYWTTVPFRGFPA